MVTASRCAACRNGIGGRRVVRKFLEEPSPWQENAVREMEEDRGADEEPPLWA